MKSYLQILDIIAWKYFKCKYFLPTGVCFSRLDCSQELVQGEGQGEEIKEEEAFRGGLSEDKKNQ